MVSCTYPLLAWCEECGDHRDLALRHTQTLCPECRWLAEHRPDPGP